MDWDDLLQALVSSDQEPPLSGISAAIRETKMQRYKRPYTCWNKHDGTSQKSPQ